MTKYNYEFEVISFDTDETMDDRLSAIENVEMVGYKKALAVHEKYYNDIVIGCDTAVVYNNEIFGKPRDKQDAYRMLSTLSGNTHQVISGVAILVGDKKYQFHCVSDVSFKELSIEQINDYIATSEPFGKAGAYAIQGIGKSLVREFQGDLENIIGMPMQMVKEVLDKLLGN